MDTAQHRPTIADLWRRLSRLQRKRHYLQWIEYMHGCCLRDVTRTVEPDRVGQTRGNVSLGSGRVVGPKRARGLGHVIWAVVPCGAREDGSLTGPIVETS